MLTSESPTVSPTTASRLIGRASTKLCWRPTSAFAVLCPSGCTATMWLITSRLRIAETTRLTKRVPRHRRRAGCGRGRCGGRRLSLTFWRWTFDRYRRPQRGTVPVSAALHESGRAALVRVSPCAATVRAGPAWPRPAAGGRAASRADSPHHRSVPHPLHWGGPGFTLGLSPWLVKWPQFRAVLPLICHTVSFD